MIHCVAAHARFNRREAGTFWLSRLRKGPSMRFYDSIFGGLLEPINRRQFQATVDRLDGDAYDKSFKSWDHLVALIYAQLSGNDSLRGVVAGFNANPQHHYHLGTGKLRRSTLSDANARRPADIFAQTFATLSAMASRQLRSEGKEMVRLIDASPIPLGKVCSWAAWNGRIRGMKLHVVYDPKGDVPKCVEVTAANVNDIEIGRQVPIQAGTTYVFDKGYCRFDWWQKINDSMAFFITRAKERIRLRAFKHRTIRKPDGAGFTVIADDEVKLTSKGDSRLPIPLRRIKVRREKGGVITLLTNDLTRTAVEIAALYKSRWQVELLFRWIKQHLDIRKFLGSNDNAIRLQVLAAMIAYLLLRIAARANCIKMPPLRLIELVGQLLFARRALATIDKPPPINPSRRKCRTSPGQIEFCYA
jgi:putative transposase